MLSHVEEINRKLESQPFLSLSEAKKNIEQDASGFYWIYSDLPLDEFKRTAPLRIKSISTLLSYQSHMKHSSM